MCQRHTVGPTKPGQQAYQALHGLEGRRQSLSMDCCAILLTTHQLALPQSGSGSPSTSWLPRELIQGRPRRACMSRALYTFSLTRWQGGEEGWVATGEVKSHLSLGRQGGQQLPHIAVEGKQTWCRPALPDCRRLLPHPQPHQSVLNLWAQRRVAFTPLLLSA